MSGERETTTVQVNPLLFMSLDPLLRKMAGSEKAISAGSVLSDLLRGMARDPIAEIERRYAEISHLDYLLRIVPHDDKVLSKIVWPLRSAKQAYLLDDSLACIALAGATGEMVASFVLDLAGIRLGDKPLTPKLQRWLFGNTVERLTQARRVEVLRAFGVWSDAEVTKANELAGIRNRYLHRISQGAESMRADALRAYQCALELTSWAVNLPIGEGGTIVLPEGIRRYLRGRPVPPD
jgi:hypothetical protein